LDIAIGVPKKDNRPRKNIKLNQNVLRTEETQPPAFNQICHFLTKKEKEGVLVDGRDG
jgi:hypothetical protein